MSKNRKFSLPISFPKLVFYAAPLIFMWIPISNPCQESTCAFIVLVTASYWMTNCLPLGVTGMLPVFLFSITGIMTIKEITLSYFISTIWLFFGVFMLAIGVQTSKLHIRIALKLLLAIGTAPKRLLLGFMLTSFVLSMFIANIPVTVMLLPIAEGLLQKLKYNIASSKVRECDEEFTQLESNDEACALEPVKQNPSTTLNKVCDEKTENRDNSKIILKDGSKIEDELEKMARAFTLAIPYSSSIGGACTLTGSVPNLVVVMLIQVAFPKSEQISFGTWFFYCTPGACLMLILSYLWILWLYFGFRANKKSFDEKKVKDLLKQQYKELGSITWEQCWILFLFFATTVLWFTRKPGFFKGWDSYFPKGYVTDGTVSLGAGLLMFLLPKNKPTFFTCKGRKEENNDRRILEFKHFQEKFYWEVLFMMGGGLTLAVGLQKSGLSDVIAKQFENFSTLQPWIIAIIFTIIASSLTECMSLFAIISLLIPVLAKLAVQAQIHPYYLCLPMFLSSKLAFMLPVSNPMNAIAYSTGFISLKDM